MMAPRQFTFWNALGVATLIRRELSREWRFFRYTIFGPALQGLLFLTVFQLAAGDAVIMAGALPFLDFLVPGLVISAALQRAFETGAYSLMDDKLSGKLQDLISAPLTALELLLSYTVANFLVALAIGVSVWLLLCLAAGFQAPVHPGLGLAYIFFGSILFSSAGLLAGIVSAKWDSLSGKETFILIPLLFLSGTFFPLSALPENWAVFMEANPVFHLIEGFRHAMTGHRGSETAYGFAITAAFALSIWGLTLICLIRGYRLKQ